MKRNDKIENVEANRILPISPQQMFPDYAVIGNSTYSYEEIEKMSILFSVNHYMEETFGFDGCSRQLIEEMAELTKALNKLWRYDLCNGNKKLDLDDIDSGRFNCIVEEIADVEISIQQIKDILLIDDKDVKEFKYAKAARANRRLGILKEGDK